MDAPGRSDSSDQVLRNSRPEFRLTGAYEAKKLTELLKMNFCPEKAGISGHAYTQKSPASFHWSDSSKNGGYLLSHLVGQYHRR